MKRIVSVALAAGIVSLSGFGPAYAQDKTVEFSLNVGTMTAIGGDASLSSFAFTVSPQVDIRVAKRFAISPEAMFITDFFNVAALPGVLLNYMGKGFFAGGGAVLPVAIAGGVGFGNVMPKVNIGYRGRDFNLTAYAVGAFEGVLQWGLVGASVGYRF